jgi:hypothetical protein
MVAQERPPDDALAQFVGHYLTSIVAGNVRQFGLPIVKDVDPPNDPAHGLVLGRKSSAFANG